MTAQVAGFCWGYVFQRFELTVIILVLGAIVSALVSRPQNGIFQGHVDFLLYLFILFIY
jgi:hypothetical protein